MHLQSSAGRANSDPRTDSAISAVQESRKQSNSQLSVKSYTFAPGFDYPSHSRPYRGSLVTRYTMIASLNSCAWLHIQDGPSSRIKWRRTAEAKSEFSEIRGQERDICWLYDWYLCRKKRSLGAITSGLRRTHKQGLVWPQWLGVEGACRGAVPTNRESQAYGIHVKWGSVRTYLLSQSVRAIRAIALARACVVFVWHSQVPPLHLTKTLGATREQELLPFERAWRSVGRNRSRDRLRHAASKEFWRFMEASQLFSRTPNRNSVERGLHVLCSTDGRHPESNARALGNGHQTGIDLPGRL